jgi:hypothetical protein
MIYQYGGSIISKSQDLDRSSVSSIPQSHMVMLVWCSDGSYQCQSFSIDNFRYQHSLRRSSDEIHLPSRFLQKALSSSDWLGERQVLLRESS